MPPLTYNGRYLMSDSGNRSKHRWNKKCIAPRLDPQNFPWTIGWSPNYQNEARIYAKYIQTEKPNARIAVLYQNDEYGKDYVKRALRSRLVAWAALARALMTEQTPEQRERYDQQHGHDRTATDVVHSATSYSRARSATSQYNR